MPNSNTTHRAAGLPSAALGNATSETQFTVAAGTPLTLYIPGSNVLKNRPFRIRAAGRVTPGTSGNFTVNIDYGVSSTYTSNTTIATTGAVNAAAAGNWALQAECFYDSTSQRIEGLQKGYVYATAVAQAILTAAATAVDLSTEGLGFTITGLFGSSNASNTAYVDVFEIEAL